MRSNIIHNLPDWQVTSFGNGLAYEIANKRASAALFFQGEDAQIFRESLEALTDRGPKLDYANALACIWSDYAESATEWGIRS